MDDDYEDMMDEIKKFFEVNKGLFDIDFFVFPETTLGSKSKKKDQKGFKVSYHFENGMDKPEIRIEGDIDEKKFQEYLKKYNIKEDPRFKMLTKKPENNKILDAKELSLEPCKEGEESCIIDPISEINENKDYIEIVLEVPGIEKEDIHITIDKQQMKILFSAEIGKRNYYKDIDIPKVYSIDDDYQLDVHNGIATLKVWKDKLI